MTAIVIAMNDFVLLLVSVALINHLALDHPARSRHALGLACAMSIALGVGGGYLLEAWLLNPWQLQDLRLFLLLPWLALLTWAVPQALGRLGTAWADIPPAQLLAVNVLTLGLILHLGDRHAGWVASLGWSVLGGTGFWLALVLFDDLRQRSRQVDVPTCLRGLPIELLGAGVMAMALSGLNGLFTQ